MAKSRHAIRMIFFPCTQERHGLFGIIDAGQIRPQRPQRPACIEGMYIDQARHDGAVAQINYLVRLGQIRSHLTLGANRLNSIATDRYETFKRQVPRTGKDALRRQDR